MKTRKRLKLSGLEDNQVQAKATMVSDKMPYLLFSLNWRCSYVAAGVHEPYEAPPMRE